MSLSADSKCAPARLGRTGSSAPAPAWTWNGLRPLSGIQLLGEGVLSGPGPSDEALLSRELGSRHGPSRGFGRTVRVSPPASAHSVVRCWRMYDWKTATGDGWPLPAREDRPASKHRDGRPNHPYGWHGLAKLPLKDALVSSVGRPRWWAHEGSAHGSTESRAPEPAGVALSRWSAGWRPTCVARHAAGTLCKAGRNARGASRDRPARAGSLRMPFCSPHTARHRMQGNHTHIRNQGSRSRNVSSRSHNRTSDTRTRDRLPCNKGIRNTGIRIRS